MSQLSKSQEFTLLKLPTLTLEQLNALEANTSTEKQQNSDDILRAIKLERIIREENLKEKDISELEAIAHETARKQRRMENYDWDIVQDSDEDNQRGFWAVIEQLEDLYAAANLEIDRRQLVLNHG